MTELPDRQAVWFVVKDLQNYSCESNSESKKHKHIRHFKPFVSEVSEKLN